MTAFDRLDAYQAAIRLIGMTRGLVLRLRRRDDVMADQLHRAVLSIACNTAEGAGEFSPGDKARLYRYALRSATESIAVLDAAREIRLCDEGEHERCRETAMRLVAMLTRLVLVTAGRATPTPAPQPKPRTRP
jgi:four helix bundle protein